MPNAFDRTPFAATFRQAAPGLEAAEWLIAAASQATPAGRLLLSKAAASLVNRGWISSTDAVVEQVAAHADLTVECLRDEVEQLTRSGLLSVVDGKIVDIAACLSARPTLWRFHSDGHAAVHLVGPLAALGVARGLGRPGTVRGRCSGGGDGATAVELHCDSQGVHSRAPETLAMFLPAWPGATDPSEAIAAGRIFADDDALSRWQAEAAEPPGLPLPSYVFPFAATDLGDRLGAAFESLFDALAIHD